MEHQAQQSVAPTYPPSMHHAPPMMHQHLPSYPLRNITQPHFHDVLCGRGGGTNAHVGNSHWRMLVAANKELYCTLPKKQKMLLSKSIVNAVRSQNPPGRFLQKDSKTSLWYDVGDQRAQEKTSQALREGAPTIRTKIKGGADSSQEESNDSPPGGDKSSPPPPPAPARPQVPMPPPQQHQMVMPPHMPHPMIYPPHPQMAVPGPSPYCPSMMMPPHGVPMAPGPYSPHHMPPGPPHMANMAIPPPIPAQGPVPERRPKQTTRPNETNSEQSANTSTKDRPATSSPRTSASKMDATKKNTETEEKSFKEKDGSPRKHSLEPIPVVANGEMPRPPMGLVDDQGCSFGSIDMTDMEHIRLMSSGSLGVGIGPVAKFPSGVPQVHFREEDLVGKDGPRRPSIGAPMPVDGGLEAIGVSFGSLMSIGSSENGASAHMPKLDTGGLSFGSAMSYSVRGDMPQAVDGGLGVGTSLGSLSIDREKVLLPGGGILDDVGTSFGSMTISTQDREDLLSAVGAGEAKDPSHPAIEEMQATIQTTFLAQQKSKGSLLECSDTESEDEEESAQNSAQKSAEWEKLQATIAAQSRVPMSSTTPPRLYGTQEIPSNIPMSSFHRDYSQMSAISVGDGDFAQYSQQVMPEGGVDYQEADDTDAMPPPPPPMQKQREQEVDEDDLDDFATLQSFSRKGGLLD